MIATSLMVVLASAPDEALMLRLAQRAESLERYVDNAVVEMKISSDELDAHGAVKTRGEMTLKVKRVNGALAERTLLSSSEDGRDTTETKRADFDKQTKTQQKNEEKERIASPFLGKQQGLYSFTQLEANEATARIAFSPKTRGEKLMEGEAVVEVKSGDLLSMKMRPSKLPKFVDRLDTTAEFGFDTGQGRAMTKLVLSGEGGLLFVRKRFAVVTEMSGYAPVKTP